LNAPPRGGKRPPLPPEGAESARERPFADASLSLRRRRDDALIAALLAALAALLALHDGAWRADRLLYDTTLSLLPRPAPDDVVIVAIDDASVEAIGRWPWPRTIHATLLDRIAAAKPRSVMLDLVLSEPDPDPAQDRWLAQALQRAAPVVVPVPWQAVGGVVGALRPVEPLRSQVRMATAEAAVDADGVLRHLFLRAGPPEASYPHAALALLEAGGGALHPALRPEGQQADDASLWQRDGRLLLRFLGPPGTVPQVPYLDVLQGRVPPARFAGRDVLIGATAQGLGDTLATPVNAGHRAMSGVEVVAQALVMLRRGDGLRSVPAWAVAAASALALVALVAGFRRLGARRALTLALASVPAVVLAAAGSIAAGWVWSPLPYAVPALLAYPLWSWRRLEHAVTVLDREIRRLAAEPLEAGPAPVAVQAEPDALAARLQELARATRLVREARGFLAGALEGLPTAMLVGDADGRVALANARAAALFEVESAADLKGLDLARLAGELAPRTPLDWFAALLKLQPGAPPLTVEASLGGADHLVHAAAIDLLGQRRLIVSVADLAPVREAQRQREETLAFVSHDLRAPAHAMLLLTDLNRRDALPPEQMLPELRRLAERTLALSEDFVLAARAMTRPLQRQPVTAQALVTEGVADLRALAEDRGVELVTAADPGPPLALDRALVVRAVANLVSNAIKHCPPGAEVLVRTRQDEAGRLVIEVSDGGPGLAPDQVAALEQGQDGVRVAGRGGVGLGLLFVQRVAQRHGGSLRVAADRPATVVLTVSGIP
jgi:CHASE2 domain-containing sensor protein/signal transduction histidine kinase